MRNYLYTMLIILVMFIFLFFMTGMLRDVSFELFKNYRTVLSYYVQKQYVLTVFLYILSYIITAASALPFASILTLIGGFLYGTIAGTFYTVVGAVIGSSMLFLLVRTVFSDYVQKRYAHQLMVMNAEFKKNGFFYLLSIRLFAVVPFFMINICAGLTPVTLQQFVVTTIVGILPATFIFSYAGRQIMQIDSLSDVLSLPMIIACIFLGFLALIPIIIKKIYNND